MQKNFRPRFLSVIIPAYKQARTIKRDLKKILGALEEIRLPCEVIVVVDGDTDQTMRQAKKIKSSHLQVVGYSHNHGKGYAVRYGMARSKGDLVAFMDAGMDINPAGISMILEHMRWYDADIIVGSKRHLVSQVNYPIIRRVYSIGYQLMIRVLFGLKIKDTQVGLKLFRRKVLEDILPRLLVKRYAFDVEILSVANMIGYNKIYEAPIQLKYQFSSSINWKEVLRMLKDTLAVFYRLRILKYYDNSNKRRWKFDPELSFKVNVG